MKGKSIRKQIVSLLLSLQLMILGVYILFATIRSFFGDYTLAFGESKSLINYIFCFYTSLTFIVFALYALLLPKDEHNVPIASEKTKTAILWLVNIFSLLVLFITIRSFLGDYLLPFGLSKTLVNYAICFCLSLFPYGTNLVEWVLLKNENDITKNNPTAIAKKKE